ncbi:efflux RND transporter periplasmic adaptor subunit [Microlunatus flavus]|uniref:Multidrug efflux pump subunit AcrA (Membrane-fusion protein) n=1 Tax=Microlunatus flavus TaxID=1036181 RepID=A0A1H9MDX3_9ACTN|nr:biotin/lipoyl-binding protein [Microlunatus flavus]SER21649.1 Multidrug efflux pump subunit AcrA (membrane-fusion protein) [Microlunatus flavus]
MPRARTRSDHPRRRRWPVVVVVALVLLGGGGALAWHLTRASSTPAAVERTVTVSKQTVKDTVGATGTVEPARRADLAFGASGTVTAVDVEVGDKVTKGDVLATLDDDDLQADLDAAQADLASAQDDLTTAEDSSSTTAAELTAAKAKVAVDESAVSQARTALKSATLRATFTGTVAEVGVAKGDTVGSGSSGSAGSSASGSGASGGGSGQSSASGASTTAVTVISTDRYTVSASVGSADLAKVKKGLQAQITTTGSTATVFGTVSSVAVMASSGSGATGAGATTAGAGATFPVTIDVTGSRKDLYAGATATVSIVVSQRDDVLTVPTAAISTANGQTAVTRLVGTGRVSTPVTLGTSYGPTTEVTKGLADGDQVVVTIPVRTAGGTPSGQSSGTGGFGGRGYGGGNGGGGFGGGGYGGGGFGGGAPPAGGVPGGQAGTGGGTR